MPPSDPEREIAALPDGWSYSFTNDGLRRIQYFRLEEPGKLYDNHPNLGPLPENWVLRKGRGVHEYYHMRKQRGNKQDLNPRYMAELKGRSGIITASSSSGFRWKVMSRKPIGTRNIRGDYYKLKQLKGGGMNDGVAVVCLKKDIFVFFVEKGFKTKSSPEEGHTPEFLHKCAMREVNFLRRLRHDALSHYAAAFLTPTTRGDFQAAVYVEWCDLGDLQNMIDKYTKRRAADPGQGGIPEGFIWHAFVSLCDALAYLQTGKSCLETDDYKPDYKPASNWLPIFHRDLKPENVLVKSRMTAGTRRYPYTVITDFGLAAEQTPSSGDKYNRQWYEAGAKWVIGTAMWWPPEISWLPGEPRPDDQFFKPPGTLSSGAADMWALGTIVYNLCTTANFNAQDWLTNEARHRTARGAPAKFDLRLWCSTTTSHISKKLEIRVGKGAYSELLRDSVVNVAAWEPGKRLTATDLMERFNELRTTSGTKGGWRNDWHEDGEHMLAGWALMRWDLAWKAEEAKKVGHGIE